MSRNASTVGLLALLAILVLAALKPAAPASALPPGFEVGSTWVTAGYSWRVEEVRGDWVRVTTRNVMEGFPPKAIWIHVPTGQVWSRM